MGQHDRCISTSPATMDNLGWAPTRSTARAASVIVGSRRSSSHYETCFRSAGICFVLFMFAIAGRWLAATVTPKAGCCIMEENAGGVLRLQ